MVDYENKSAQPVYGCVIYVSVLVNEMPKSARYHIDRANSIVFTSKRLPLQPVSSERNHQVADKFRKVSCLNVYGRKRGRVGVKQCMHSFHSLDCLLSVFFPVITCRNYFRDNAISFGLTLRLAKTSKQTSHAIFYA